METTNKKRKEIPKTIDPCFSMSMLKKGNNSFSVTPVSNFTTLCQKLQIDQNQIDSPYPNNQNQEQIQNSQKNGNELKQEDYIDIQLGEINFYLDQDIIVNYLQFQAQKTTNKNNDNTNEEMFTNLFQCITRFGDLNTQIKINQQLNQPCQFSLNLKKLNIEIFDFVNHYQQEIYGNQIEIKNIKVQTINDSNENICKKLNPSQLNKLQKYKIQRINIQNILINSIKRLKTNGIINRIRESVQEEFINEQEEEQEEDDDKDEEINKNNKGIDENDKLEKIVQIEKKTKSQQELQKKKDTEILNQKISFLRQSNYKQQKVTKIFESSLNCVISKAKIQNHPLLIDKIINLQIPYTYLNVNDDQQGLIKWIIFLKSEIQKSQPKQKDDVNQYNIPQKSSENIYFKKQNYQMHYKCQLQQELKILKKCHQDIRDRNSINNSQADSNKKVDMNQTAKQKSCKHCIIKLKKSNTIVNVFFGNIFDYQQNQQLDLELLLIRNDIKKNKANSLRGLNIYFNTKMHKNQQFLIQFDYLHILQEKGFFKNNFIIHSSDFQSDIKQQEDQEQNKAYNKNFEQFQYSSIDRLQIKPLIQIDFGYLKYTQENIYLYISMLQNMIIQKSEKQQNVKNDEQNVKLLFLHKQVINDELLGLFDFDQADQIPNNMLYCQLEQISIDFKNILSCFNLYNMTQRVTFLDRIKKKMIDENELNNNYKQQNSLENIDKEELKKIDCSLVNSWNQSVVVFDIQKFILRINITYQNNNNDNLYVTLKDLNVRFNDNYLLGKEFSNKEMLKLENLKIVFFDQILYLQNLTFLIIDKNELHMRLQKILINKVKNDEVLDTLFQVPHQEKIQKKIAMEIKIFINDTQYLNSLQIIIEPMQFKFCQKQIQQQLQGLILIYLLNIHTRNQGLNYINEKVFLKQQSQKLQQIIIEDVIENMQENNEKSIFLNFNVQLDIKQMNLLIIHNDNQSIQFMLERLCYQNRKNNQTIKLNNIRLIHNPDQDLIYQETVLFKKDSQDNLIIEKIFKENVWNISLKSVTFIIVLKHIQDVSNFFQELQTNSQKSINQVEQKLFIKKQKVFQAFDNHRFIEVTNQLKRKIVLKLRNIEFIFPRNHVSDEKFIIGIKSCNIRKKFQYHKEYIQQWIEKQLLKKTFWENKQALKNIIKQVSIKPSLAMLLTLIFKIKQIKIEINDKDNNLLLVDISSLKFMTEQLFYKKNDLGSIWNQYQKHKVKISDISQQNQLTKMTTLIQNIKQKYFNEDTDLFEFIKDDLIHKKQDKVINLQDMQWEQRRSIEDNVDDLNYQLQAIISSQDD